MTSKESINKRIAVIGGGPMGLTCAYCLAKKGYSVDVYEADSILGGMSAHFDFGPKYREILSFCMRAGLSAV